MVSCVVKTDAKGGGGKWWIYIGGATSGSEPERTWHVAKDI